MQNWHKFLGISSGILNVFLFMYFINQPNETPVQNQIQQDIEVQLIQDPNPHVFKYVNLPFENSFGSNSIPLVIAGLLTHGDLLELGMGMYSTPILYRISMEYKRNLVSIDTSLDWINKFISYNLTNYHKIYYFKNHQELSEFGKDRKWGMVLVDHTYAALRPFDVINFADKAEIVLAHDAESSSDFMYKYNEKNVRSHFKYACKFSVFHGKQKTSHTSTIILSNKIDLNKLQIIFDKVRTEFGHTSCDLNL